MSITDGLREWASHINENSHLGYLTDAGKQGLRNIADNIDAAHCKTLGETADAAYAEGAESVPIAVDENAWVRLPVDADGVPWHVGDFAVGEVNPKNPKAIERMIWYGPDSGWQLETDTIIYPCPDRPRHNRTPTVEDVLREFTDAILEWAGKSGSVAEIGTWSDVAAEYAAKLRLAGEGE